LILVTGGAGFIGSNFILDWFSSCGESLFNLDKLTYAGNLSSIASLGSDPRNNFVLGDIGDFDLVSGLLRRGGVRAVVHFAAESHVDRSINGPEEFVQTNIVGTFRLLEAVRSHWSGLGGEDRSSFRFLHVSTDEVYGSLGPDDEPFTEGSQYRPNSPYSASKAASDHLVRSYYHTYGLPVLTTNCSNNYGPFQFPEKLIPLCIQRAIGGMEIPVYGDGMQVRDWLYVGDHCAAIRRVLEAGRPGEVYNVGGSHEVANIDVVRSICAILDEERPRIFGGSYSEQISFVTDRPGHDRRYAIDHSKITSELGWLPSESFQTGLSKTVRWYLSNQGWVGSLGNKT
jgi:dTDP-glucose 4,6-dehydratase